MFNNLHLMLKEKYTELVQVVDEIAEQIRALGHPAPGSYAAYAELTAISKEHDSPDAELMIRRLVDAQQTVVKTARSLLGVVEDAQDEPTADLLTQRMKRMPGCSAA